MAKSGLLSAESPTIGTAVDADTLIRGILFVAAFLSVWISFHPFQSLAEPPEALSSGGDSANRIGFTAMLLSLATWTYFHEPRRLAVLWRPTLAVMLAWFVLSVITSWEPSLAARRLTFTMVVMGICAMVLLLPKNLRQFSDLMAITALIVLAVCYAGIVFAPQLAIHQATDFLEPEHAGNWRGVFPHKNQAGATMVIFIFIGMFVMRVRSVLLGGLIVVPASIFLVFTQSKTAIGVLPLVLVLSAIIARRRVPAVGITLVVFVLAAFNFLSVGTVLFEPVRGLVEAIMPDATFTGRTDIWQLALAALMQRPITGYGLSSFWGTEEVVYGLAGNATWANAATDAHNGYLNLALSVGLPGLVLVIAWIVILPILDFYRQPRDARTFPLSLLFLRVCLYGIYASCFESTIFQQVGEVWFIFMIAVFGLRYLSVARVTV